MGVGVGWSPELRSPAPRASRAVPRNLRPRNLRPAAHALIPPIEPRN